MVQTVGEYTELLCKSELKAFGFSGTRLPAHVKQLVFSFQEPTLSQDDRERLENQACARMGKRKNLPQGVWMTGVEIICCEDD